MILSRWTLPPETPHLNPLPFGKGRGGRSPADFVVEEERRYWLHIAIDRFDGSIVGQQLEEVTE